MFSRDELVAQAQRRYTDFLRAIVEARNLFPLELRIGKSRRAESYAERAAELAAFRAAASALGIIVEWRLVVDPRFGAHERPERAYFADEATFLSALNKAAEALQFRHDVDLIRAKCPPLEMWLSDHVRDIVEQHDAWPRLLRCVRWFLANARCGLYLRQLPVEGVDTKFFERKAPILDALLLHVQPELVTTNERRFEARHGLRWEKPLIRIRFLDTGLQAARGFPVADLAVPVPVFRILPLGGTIAIITENLRNFLALPPLPQTVAVLGSGDAAALLAGASWLTQSRILYWGDMDARGFAILARLRDALPHTESVMMDLQTLETHRIFAVEVAPYQLQIAGLTTEESTALQKLGSEGLWLEQERLPFPAVTKSLEQRIASVP